MSEERELINISNHISKDCHEKFKEIMELFKTKKYITDITYNENKQYFISVSDIAGIKSFRVNHPVYDFFKELSNQGFIKESTGKIYYTDIVENVPENVRPTPMRIDFKLDEAPPKKIQFIKFLDLYKEQILQVQDLYDHIKQWKEEIAQRSEVSSIEDRSDEVKSDEKQISEVTHTSPVPWSRHVHKLPIISPDSRGNQIYQEKVRNVKQSFIELINILKKKKHIAIPGVGKDNFRKFLDNNQGFLPIQSYVEKGKILKTTCTLLILLDPLIKSGVVNFDDEVEDLTDRRGVYKNKDNLRFNCYMFYIRVNADACDQEEAESLIETFKEIKRKAKAYPPFEKLTKVNKNNFDDDDNHRGSYKNNFRSSIFNQSSQTYDESSSSVEMQAFRPCASVVPQPQNN